MAGLKKTGKKDASSPNMVLLIALILFILTSIGLGVFAYYGYEGQQKLKNDVTAANNKSNSFKLDRDNFQLIVYEMMIAEGYELTPEQKTVFNALKNDLIGAPDNFKDVKPLMEAMVAEHLAKLKGYNAQETKYESNYKAQIIAALDEAKKAKTLLDSVQKEYNDFKSRYEDLNSRFEKEIKALHASIEAGNKAAAAIAAMTNQKFPEIETQLVARTKDIEALANKHNDELGERDGRIARLGQEKVDLEKKLNDRSLGTAFGPQGGGGGDAHALMLDISRGMPLWDRPLGKIIRVDPTHLLVTIDIGSKAGIRPDVSFNVFGTGPGGKADKQLKGTIEVVRVVNETTSTCRITSLYDSEGKSIPVQLESLRLQATKAVDNILREGDLLFNTFFDTHVFIVGNVNFTGYLSDTPATQDLQLRDFMDQLRKQNIVVDGYINLKNGQVEGNITPRTRLLIRGDLAPINRSEEERNRNKVIVEAYQVLKRQAIDQGMFIISAENLATVIGYRPPQMQNNKDLQSSFQPSLPWTGGPNIRRFDPQVEGGPGVAAPAIPAPAMDKKE